MPNGNTIDLALESLINYGDSNTTPATTTHTTTHTTTTTAGEQKSSEVVAAPSRLPMPAPYPGPLPAMSHPRGNSTHTHAFLAHPNVGGAVPSFLGQSTLPPSSSAVPAVVMSPGVPAIFTAPPPPPPLMVNVETNSRVHSTAVQSPRATSFTAAAASVVVNNHHHLGVPNNNSINNSNVNDHPSKRSISPAEPSAVDSQGQGQGQSQSRGSGSGSSGSGSGSGSGVKRGRKSLYTKILEKTKHGEPIGQMDVPEQLVTTLKVDPATLDNLDPDEVPDMIRQYQRKRNCEASARYRKKKTSEIDELKRRLDDTELELERWKSRCASLEKQLHDRGG